MTLNFLGKKLKFQGNKIAMKNYMVHDHDRNGDVEKVVKDTLDKLLPKWNMPNSTSAQPSTTSSKGKRNTASI